MWCVPKLDAEYVARMEDVLNTLSRPMDPNEPVVALDERPVLLRDSVRDGIPTRAGHVARRDYEYERRGTANLYGIVAPKLGMHWTHATPNRKRDWFARALQRVVRSFPRAKRIHLILDNLNIHCEKSVREALGDLEGLRLWRRFEVHHTPKHASWLNPAEIELSLWSRECLGRKRVGQLCELRRETRVWNARANRRKRTIDWRFSTADARRVFGYRRFTARAAEH
jgi:hypothetical protein